MLKNLRYLPLATRADVLLVDNEAHHLVCCVPSGATWLNVPIRGQQWYFNSRILWQLAVAYIKRRKYRLGRRGCYVAALAKAVDSRVILTLIDNNNWDIGICEAYRIRVICICSGLRHPEQIQNKKFDCYCSFSEIPIDPLKNFNIQCSEYILCGSLKAGLFYERAGPPIPGRPSGKKLTIAWISQHRPHEYPLDATEDQKAVFREKNAIELRMTEFLKRYAEQKGYRLQVIMASLRKGVGQLAEASFYRQHMGDDVALSVDLGTSSSDWVSYELVWQADLVMSVYSTLLFEAASIGKRSIFCFPRERGYLRSYLEEATDYGILDSLIPAGPSYEEFCHICDRIIGMNSKEYNTIVNAVRAKVAFFDPQNLPQQVIRDRITDIVCGETKSARPVRGSGATG